MAVTDLRVALDVFDNTLATGDYADVSSAAVDTEVFYQGDRSISENMNNSERYILLDLGAPTDVTSNTFYFLILCGVTGNLLSKAAGGFRIRFSGANLNNSWFEVYVGGNDEWPNSFAGGWTMFAVDIEEARAIAIANGQTGGSPAAVTQIQYAGYVGQTQGMIRTNDNTWLNGIWRLPTGDAGVAVTGTGETLASVLTASETNLWGSIRRGAGGSIVSDVGFRFGNTTAVAAESFSDTNRTLLWADNEYLNDLHYVFDVQGSASGMTFTIGSKTGTGNTASGAQGFTVQASSTLGRWCFKGNNNNTTLNIYGSTFVHSSNLEFQNDSLECISTTFIDGQKINLSTAGGTGTLIKPLIVNANTADGTAYIIADDLATLNGVTANFSDGHAIELTALGAGTTFAFEDHTFIGYGADTTNDAAFYNNSGQDIVLAGDNISGFTFRNGTSANTDLQQFVNFDITNIYGGTELRLFTDPALAELGGAEDVANAASYTAGFSQLSGPDAQDRYSVRYQYNYTVDTDIFVVAHSLEYQYLRLSSTLDSDGGSLQINQSIDRQYDVGSV